MPYSISITFQDHTSYHREEMVTFLCPSYFRIFTVRSRFLTLLQITIFARRASFMLLGKRSLSESPCGLGSHAGTVALDSWVPAGQSLPLSPALSLDQLASKFRSKRHLSSSLFFLRNFPLSSKLMDSPMGASVVPQWYLTKVASSVPAPPQKIQLRPIEKPKLSLEKSDLIKALKEIDPSRLNCSC